MTAQHTFVHRPPAAARGMAACYVAARRATSRYPVARVIAAHGPRAYRQAGFSLLEVLVAFVILAIVGTMLSGLYSGSLRNAGAAEDWSHATLLAESQLTAAAAVSPLRVGNSSGTDADDRFTWTTTVEPYSPPGVSDSLLNSSVNMPTQLLRVSVNVTFPSALGASRTITLSTVRLVRKELLR